MTKVDIKRLDSITKNDTTATAQINDNFLALQTAIENTLSRDGTGPNYMDADLDMNSYRIINSSDPVEENDIVNLKYVEERIGGAVEASKTAVSAASQAASSAQSALVSATNAINTLRNAEENVNLTNQLLTDTRQYVDDTKEEIKVIVAEAEASVDDAIAQATEEVRQAALETAQEAINDAAAQATAIVVDYANNDIKPELLSYRDSAAESSASAADSASLSRTWATGSDDEVQVIEPDEHSSRTYANFSMALANAPEDVPVLESTLLATDVVKGPKGDSGEAEFSGDVQFEGSFNVHGDDNHPVKVTSLAGASASGFQVVDSNGAGESDFEHAATGDRYITRIANKSTATGNSVNVDLYQTTAGKSVLDLSKPDTILAPQLLDIIFPIGSYYLSEEDSCPLADWMDSCQWEKVGTSLVSGTEAPVVGNGMTLGLTNGTTNYGMVCGANDYYTGNTGVYGANVGTTRSGSNMGDALSYGITTDPEKSGIVANLPTITVNIFRRIM